MTEAEKRQTVRLTNIQRFCLHDGPGVRTTVFLKGCSIHCPWCANPENICYEIQTWHDSTTNESGQYGDDITLEALYQKVMRDKCFYLDGGGVTFSGGEPLLQIRRLEPLLKALKNEDIHLAIETALFVDEKCVQTALKYIDWWYVDMKIIPPEQCRKVLGGQAEQYEKNLSLVAGNAPNICVRIPCCCGWTDAPENIDSIVKLIQRNAIKKIELLEVHDIAKKKRVTLGIENSKIPTDNRAAAESTARLLREHGKACEILHL